MNPTSIPEDSGSIPGLAQWVKGSGIAMSCGVGHRRSSDIALLLLWHRLAVAAPIWPLAWELSFAKNAAQKSKKKKSVFLMTAYVWPLIIHSAEAPWRSSQKKKLRPKDSALSLQKFRPLLWPEFDPWPRNAKKKKERERQRKYSTTNYFLLILSPALTFW